MTMISHQTENINKVIEMTKETQIEFLEMRSRITEVIGVRFKLDEDRMSELGRHKLTLV